MAKKRNYKPTEVEAILQAAREVEGFTGKTERIAMHNIVETAKRNGRIGDKIIVTIAPKYIHIPNWQRSLDITIANAIGLSYNKNKWEMPKVILNNGVLVCVDGMHRIFGAYIGEIDCIVVEILDISEEEAIEIFLSQTKDRNRMRPQDYLNASLEAKKPEYIAMKDICTKHNIQLKGHDFVDSPIGIFTSLNDGKNMCKANPDMFDHILGLIVNLKWNNINSDNGNAFGSTYIRIFKKLYGYYADNIAEMERILLENCSGTVFFANVAEKKTQNQLFDYLSELIQNKLENKKRKAV